MKLRRAVPGDEGKLALVGSASFLESFANDHDGDAVVKFVDETHSTAYYAKILADPACRTWLVEEAVGAPVGYAVLQPANLPETDAATDVELKRIYVLSKWHGGGWGAKLYQAIEDEARARGAKRLVLSVYVHNHNAQKFYAKRGFGQIGRWEFAGFEQTDASEDFIYAKPL
ncbi:GNAT family N-acetyltransferase [Sphingomonas antarctica]|uniref:GNAT family N-acetyltransferase n=1 Tax=Sphingomonas antarctica TaxID=2040274 RepID=UPI0039E9D970